MAPNTPLQLSFVKSAPSVDDLPDSDGEIAFAGRSNVGKSSLINALANRTGLAATSKTPGRTQLLNIFVLPTGRTVVDLPGYGFAKVPARVRAGWAQMIQRYLLERQALRCVVVLVDAEVGPTALDLETLTWLADNDVPFHVVATKHDKVKPARRDKRKAELAAKCGLDPKEILWVSSAKNVNIDELRKRAYRWLHED
ncbi:MAG TPA: YihA family ribosome biogenesis GTP-binding protein [Acidimicrobiaceae bacterium]|jgi:GTP-binding protein|nr:YihA family ribosome biogenesis GTP-binding protein [Acidimicrobiaceae bacterium]